MNYSAAQHQWAFVSNFVELSLRTGSFGLTGCCDGTDAFSFFEQHLANTVPIKQDPVQCDTVVGIKGNYEIIFAGFFFYAARKVFISLKDKRHLMFPPARFMTLTVGCQFLSPTHDQDAAQQAKRTSTLVI